MLSGINCFFLGPTHCSTQNIALAAQCRTPSLHIRLPQQSDRTYNHWWPGNEAGWWPGDEAQTFALYGRRPLCKNVEDKLAFVLYRKAMLF